MAVALEFPFRPLFMHMYSIKMRSPRMSQRSQRNNVKCKWCKKLLLEACVLKYTGNNNIMLKCENLDLVEIRKEYYCVRGDWAIAEVRTECDVRVREWKKIVINYRFKTVNRRQISYQ